MGRQSIIDCHEHCTFFSSFCQEGGPFGVNFGLGVSYRRGSTEGGVSLTGPPLSCVPRYCFVQPIVFRVYSSVTCPRWLTNTLDGFGDEMLSFDSWIPQTMCLQEGWPYLDLEFSFPGSGHIIARMF